MFRKIVIALVLAASALTMQAYSYTASYTNLETIVPGIDIKPADVNPGLPPPTSFTDEPWAGGTTINVDGPPYSAGLSKRSVPLPPNVSQFTLTYQINPSETATLYAQVYETDLIIVDPNGNRYNGSCQMNNAVVWSNNKVCEKIVLIGEI